MTTNTPPAPTPPAQPHIDQVRSSFMERVDPVDDRYQLGLGFAGGKPTAHNPFPVSARHLLGE